MPLLSTDYFTTSLIPEKELKNSIEILSPEIERLAAARQQGYTTPYSFINVPFDQKNFEQVNTLVHQKKLLRPSLLLLIGIGGSNLGTLAVFQALKGLYFNELTPVCKFYCADTLDAQSACALQALIEALLQKGQEVLIVVVTKSGTTVETMANAAFFLDLLVKHRASRWSDYVVYITDNDSLLYQHGRQHNIALLEIPAPVGGRYSVLSPVGLFSLQFLEIDTEQLLAGARDVTNSCLCVDITNPAAASAALIYAHYKRDRTIHDMFLFNPAYTLLGAWYRQLMGESIGKAGKGITPTVSVGTIDLHSVAQLYLGGPDHRFTTFVTEKKSSSWPHIPPFFADISYGAGFSFNHVSSAIFQAVQTAYAERQRPFMTINLSAEPYQLGQFLQYKMIEMVYLGFLFQVNCFDQPEVELYKQETRRILGYES
jgi:glucose-6-phosphate isomerase